MALLWQVLLQMKHCASGKCSNRLRIRKNQLSSPQDRHVATTQGWKWIRLTKKCAREARLTSSWLTTRRYFKLHLLSSTGSAWDEGFINFDWRTLIPSLKALSPNSLELSMKFNFNCKSCHHTPLHTLTFSWYLSLCVHNYSHCMERGEGNSSLMWIRNIYLWLLNVKFIKLYT